MYRFEPILKNALWGCEHWMISGVKDNETTVSGGSAHGLSLSQLIDQEKESLMGRRNYEHYGHEFPLLIKMIDAHRDLSIQVHPNDEMAQKRGYPRGKTEMWYLMESDENAHLRAGLRKQITPWQYKEMVSQGTITDALAEYAVREGDCFFLPAGRIHSIGAGCRLAEIQQTSDVTYRIYDFKRKDAQGHERQLHTEEAAECIDYQVQPDYQTHYQHRTNERIPLVDCPYFCTSVYEIDGTKEIDYSQLDSFVILMVTEGNLCIDHQYSVKKGDTLLLPATTSGCEMSGTGKMLEVYTA